VIVRYEISLRDCRAARDLDRKNSPNILADPRKWYVIVPVVTFVVFLSGRLAGFRALQDIGEFFCFSALVSIPIHLGYDEWRLRGWFQSNFPPQPEKEAYTLEANDEGMFVANPGRVETRVTWNAIRSLARNEKITLVYLSPDNYFYFPTRALTTDQRVELDELVASHHKGTYPC
jgi:hypothetical protein